MNDVMPIILHSQGVPLIKRPPEPEPEINEDELNEEEKAALTEKKKKEEAAAKKKKAA
jgi:hypothetical protein